MPRIIDISDSFTSASEPSVGAISAAGFQTYVDDAAFETANGAGAEGDAYFNTTSKLIRRHDGTSWANVPEDDTVVHLTGNETIAGEKTFSNDMVINANLTVTGTTTQVDTTNTNIKDKNILINDGGDDASSEGAGITVERTGTDGSFIYADAAASKFKCGALGSEIEIADLSSAQSLSNKTLAAPLMSSYDDFTHIAKPANPGAGTLRVYAKSDNQMYTLDPAGTETAIGSGGSGSGTGRINYIDTGSAQLETDTGSWATYDDAGEGSDDSIPFNGTGGSATVISISQETTDPLNGSGSLKISKTAADGRGEGVAVAFTVDRAELGLVNEISFNYITDANYADGDFAIWIYDVDNGTLIQPVPYELLASTTPNRFKAFFQCTYNATTANANDYRLIVHCTTTSATTREVLIDEILVGPPQYNFGAPVTDWKAAKTEVVLKYGGTTATNITSYTTKIARVGDTAHIMSKILFSGAANAAGTITVTLPDTLVIDTSKIVGSSTSDQIVGRALFLDTGTANYAASIGYESTTSVRIRTQGAAGTYVDYSNATDAIPIGTLANNDSLTLVFSIPILGWSSSVRMSSDDADTRVIELIAGLKQPSGAISGETTVIMPSVDKDSHNKYNTTTGLYTASVSGYYPVDFHARISGTATASAYVTTRIYVGSTEKHRKSVDNTGTTLTYLTPEISHSVYALAGETIKVTVQTNLTSAVWDASLASLSIKKDSGHSAIGASELVKFSASRITSNQTITAGSPADVIFQNVVENSHGFYDSSTGRFTSSVSGRYNFETVIRILMGATAATNCAVYFQRSDGVVFSPDYSDDFSNSKTYTFKTHAQIDLIAGQYVTVKMSCTGQDVDVVFNASNLNSVFYGCRQGF